MDVVEPALWKEFRDARAAGVLVMNCDHPGLYLAHTSHVDVPAAVPKYVAPYRVNLAERCETREDGYREVMIHVVSGPDMEAERLLLRNRVLPMLTERCRTRRVRPIYVDLRDDAAGCGPGLAVRAAEVAREGAVHVVLLSGKHEPETHANERLKTFIEKIPRGGAQAKFDWMRFAPQDYSRLEYVVAARFYTPGRRARVDENCRQARTTVPELAQRKHASRQSIHPQRIDREEREESRRRRGRAARRRRRRE